MGLLANRAIAIDPALMMRKAGMMPDEWQKRVLREQHKRVLLNCCRQSGKTTIIACKTLDKSLYHAPSLTLILGPSERQSKELIRKIDNIRKCLGVSVNPERQTTTSMEFLSGSRIVAFPAKEQNIRGLSAVDYLVLDEASRIPDELYEAVRPMLAVSDGSIACMSTPFGKRGFFFREWTEGIGWEKIKITAEQCPRITPAFLAEEKRTLPKEWFRQEYYCEFAETTNAVFSYEDVQASLTNAVQPLMLVPNEAGLDAAVKPLRLT